MTLPRKILRAIGIAFCLSAVILGAVPSEKLAELTQTTQEQSR